MKIVSTIAVLLLCGAPVFAQSPPCEHAIVVTVTTKQGPIATLPRDLFEVKVGGNRADVKQVERAPLRRMVLLVDLSGSMDEKRPLVDHALSVILNSAPQGTDVGLVGFADEVHVLAGIGSSREQVWQSWLDLPSFDVKQRKKKKKADPPEPLGFGQGRTALRDALLAGMDMLGDARPADVLLVIGDGGDNRSNSKEKLVFQRLRESQVRVAALLLLDIHPVTPEEVRAPALLQSFADVGGGFVARLPSSEGLTKLDIRAAVDWLLGSLTASQRLTLELREAVEKPTQVRVRISKEAQLKEVRAYYPDRLKPCSTGVAQSRP
jgi:Mg-chelatase subunit ChlD